MKSGPTASGRKARRAATAGRAERSQALPRPGSWSAIGAIGRYTRLGRGAFGSGSLGVWVMQDGVGSVLLEYYRASYRCLAVWILSCVMPVHSGFLAAAAVMRERAMASYRLHRPVLFGSPPGWLARAGWVVL
jgi:hypothetical protein